MKKTIGESQPARCVRDDVSLEQHAKRFSLVFLANFRNGTLSEDQRREFPIPSRLLWV